MNIPEIYLVEPYNAYTHQQGGRKKHWHEIIEEQALMQRIVAEQIALQEAASRTLPPNSPPISQATVGNSTGVAGGAGGLPVVDFFHPEWDVIGFTASPLTGDGPLTVKFINTTTTPYLDSYLWKFGDGTTSTDVNPIHVYQSGSKTGYTVELTSSHQVPNGAMTSSVGYISASIPSVTAGFTYVTSSGPGPTTVTFANTSVNTSQTPTSTYLWLFGSNGDNSTSLTPSPYTYANTGSFTASLQTTGSYGIASKYTQSYYIPAPTLTAVISVTTSSKNAPSTASFTNVPSYNGKGTLTYLWLLGSGSLTATTIVPSPTIYVNAGNYTASLQITESSYGIKTLVTQSWRLA